MQNVVEREKGEKNIDVETPQENNQEEENREEGSISWETFKQYIVAINILIFALFVITNTGMQLARTLIDFWLKSNSDTDIFQNEKNNKESLGTLGGFSEKFAYLLALQFLITFLRCALYASYNLLSGRNIFNRLIKIIMFSKISFFDTNSPGSILNRITADTFEIDDRLPWYIHVFFECFARVLLYPIVVIIEFPLISIGKQ